MFFTRFLSSLFLGVLALPASAASATEQQLAAQLSILLNGQHHGSEDFPVVRSAKILTPADKLKRLCGQPVLTLAGNDTHLTGNRSVAARCGKERIYIQIAIQAQGSWWSTTGSLKAGSTLTLKDIQRHQGSLEHLPAGLIFTPGEIVGRVTTRNVAAGTPVTQNVLRREWLIRAGQEVDVIAVGDGFTVHVQGKALDNAAANEKLRVSLRSTRQVATGIVQAGGSVMIDVK